MTDTPKPTVHFFEISLPYVFEYFAKFFPRPPGRHYVGQPEWIVDRDQGRVVFKLFSQPDEPPAPDVEPPSESGEKT